MIAVLRPVATSSDPTSRSPALFRDGLSSARRELRAGTARRHRAAAEGPPDVAPDPAAAVAPQPASDLATQRAGVAAALAELRRHRGTR